MNNDVYYKVYVDSDDLITVVCMQHFDEDAYDQNRFYTNGLGESVKFECKSDAIDFINEKFKPEYIDPQYSNNYPGSSQFWKEREI